MSEQRQQTLAQVDRIRMLWGIFWTFFKISPLTFGGGYVMIPLLEREFVERKKWVKSEEIADIFAVSESVPGSIAVNSGTFIGFRLAGVSGAIAAMTGAISPTFLILLAFAMLLLGRQDYPLVQAAFMGIRPSIVALIIYAGYKIGKTAVIDKTTFTIVFLTIGFMLFTHIHPIITILSGGLCGIGLRMIKNRLR
ncbi:chromate transporter [Effusibacillus consociatus]|uniref:Chromate transporter n=1 Tax=Effusibacillus consociatus TaxID=1117041 RepID=A0ABV9Q5D1_9BACL